METWRNIPLSCGGRMGYSFWIWWIIRQAFANSFLADFMVCWLLGTPVQEIGLLCTMKEAFLPKHVRCAYNQHSPFCVCAPTMRPFHKEEVLLVLCVFSSIKQRVSFCLHALQEHVLRWMKPPTTPLVIGTLAGLTRGKAELRAENALLRHQLLILHRQVKRPAYRKRDRLLLVLLARMVRTWKEVLFLVQPETRLSLAS